MRRGPARRSVSAGGWLFASLLLIALPGSAVAADRCSFVRAGSTWTLAADCTTDHSIVIPDGVALDGNHHAIVAIDPTDDFFRGGVIVSGGGTATVTNVTVTAVMLADVCQVGRDRLRGIVFDGASGVIRGNSILYINKPGSSCQEGNAIEVANRSGGAPTMVEVSDNSIEGFEKTGVMASGNADVTIRGNTIGPSAAQALMPTNGIQVGPGARALIEGNTVAGNSWRTGDAAGTAILLQQSGPGTTVRGNVIVGNADVGIYVAASNTVIERNRLTDSGPDGPFDIGIGNYGDDNTFDGNRITGYTHQYQGVDEPAAVVGKVAALE